MPSAPPAAAPSAVLILVATCAAVSAAVIVPTDMGTPPFRPAAATVIAAGAPPAAPPAAVKPPVPFTAVGVLIAASNCACVIPVTVLTTRPLIVNAPLLFNAAGMTCVPVTSASSSVESVAPKPVILAGAGAPAIGLAENVLGSIS